MLATIQVILLFLAVVALGILCYIFFHALMVLQTMEDHVEKLAKIQFCNLKENKNDNSARPSS